MLVVADTSVLLNLCRVGHEHLLPPLFREVQIPPAVHGEFVQLSQNHARFRGLVLPGWVKISTAVAVPREVADCPDLDAGETEALALALQIQADAVLLDEAAARLAAVHSSYPSSESPAFFFAKAHGLIATVRPVLDRLRAEAAFWLAPAFQAEVLRLAGETP